MAIEFVNFWDNLDHLKGQIGQAENRRKGFAYERRGDLSGGVKQWAIFQSNQLQHSETG